MSSFAFRSPGSTFLVLVALWLALPLPPTMAQEYEPPRTAAGRPSFEGVWTNASLTRLSRPSSIDELVLSQERAEELAGGHFHNVRAARDDQPTDPNRGAPEVVESLPPVGNYNAGWVDPGTRYGVVNGEIRSSWITVPESGRAPLRAEVRERAMERRPLRRYPPDPEVLSLGERCLIGFGGTAGPPMLNVLYNNYYRIVQTDDHVMILVEMVHDARIVKIGGEHAAADSRRWLGDSVGHWDGDTLVIETTNFHAARGRQGPLYYSGTAKVVERLTRVADDSIHYAFEVDDPVNYEAPIAGEMSFTGVSDRLYEYACHEGNYAMGNILRGARLLEAEAGE